MPSPKQMAQALMAGAKPPQGPPDPQREPSGGEKIDRSAFVYLEGQDDTFAQCGSCAFGPDKCALMGGNPVDPEVGSCALYVPGEPIGQPIAQLDPEEIGYVEHPVRCENCRYFDNGNCGLFAEINQAFPDQFQLDEKVQPYGCCNGQMPNG